MTLALMWMALPVPAQAAWLVLQNDLPHGVTIQAAAVTNRGIIPFRVYRLLPGEKSQEFLMQPVISISIFDARNPGRGALGQQVVPLLNNQSFAIQRDQVNGVILSPVPFGIRNPGRPQGKSHSGPP